MRFLSTSKLSCLTPIPSFHPLSSHFPLPPKLSIPTLQQTIPKYLYTLQPLLSSKDYLIAVTDANAFLSSPLSATLQSRLVARNEQFTQGWLIDWWNESAYFAYRDSVVVNVSYFYVFNDFPKHKQISFLYVASSLIDGALRYRQMIKDGNLPVEKLKGEVLSMDQYALLFDSCRVPGKVKDYAVLDESGSAEIMVIRKNQVFFVNVKRGNEMVSKEEIYAQLARVVEMAGEEKGLAIGALTSENRDTWFEAHEKLKSLGNGAVLERMQRSILGVCLDDYAPITREETSRACWHGDGQNRWYDKFCQFIVFENGKAGFMGEHSLMDGTPTTNMVDWVCK